MKWCTQIKKCDFCGFQDFWILGHFFMFESGKTINDITKLFSLVERNDPNLLFLGSKIALKHIFKKYWDFKMCPKAPLLPRRRSKWFWAQFCIPVTYLEICRTAMLGPRNKRFEPQFSTEKKQFSHISDQFSRFDNQKWPKIEKPWISQKIIFFVHGCVISERPKILKIWS